MSNELRIFNNEEFGEVRIILIDGKEYFVANDVATILGYKRTADAITAHCKGSISRIIDTNGGKQMCKLILQEDVLLLIVKSKLCTTDYKNNFIKWLQQENLINNNILPLSSRKEVEFLSKLDKILKQFKIKIKRQKRVGDYIVDAYIREMNCVIEYDEKNHIGYNPEDEQIREQIIKDELNCDFIRVTDKNDDYNNIGYILNKILNTTV